jgi:hypothetical protein
MPDRPTTTTSRPAWIVAPRNGAFLEFGSVASLEEAVRARAGAGSPISRRMGATRCVFGGTWCLPLSRCCRWRSARRQRRHLSVINAVMLRPMAVPEPERLVLITRVGDDGRPLLLSFRLFETMRERLTSVSGVLVGTANQTAVIDGDDELVSSIWCPVPISKCSAFRRRWDACCRRPAVLAAPLR